MNAVRTRRRRTVTNSQSALPTDFVNFDRLPNSALITQRCLELLFSTSSTTIWRRVNAGNLPQPIKYGAQTRWRAGEIRIVLNGGFHNV